MRVIDELLLQDLLENGIDRLLRARPKHGREGESIGTARAQRLRVAARHGGGGIGEIRARDRAAAWKVEQPKLLELLCPRESMIQDLPLRVVCFEDLRRQGDATRFLRPCTRCADSEACK